MTPTIAGMALGKVLITGAEGNIASGLLDALSLAGNTIWSTTRRRDAVGSRRLFVDLSESPHQWSLPPGPVDVAFLCAGVGSQERCGIEPEATRQINVLQTFELARTLAAQGAFVIFISTNLVLDGQTPFAAKDQPYNPQTAYGVQKAEAEQQLLKLGKQIAIVRLGKVIVPGMALFDRWADDLSEGKTIHPFQDMVMAPIPLSFALDVLCRVAFQRRSGITQATAMRDISYAQAAQSIARNLGASEGLIAPVRGQHSTHIYSPRHTTLDPACLVSLGLTAPQPERAFDHFAHAPNNNVFLPLCCRPRKSP